MNRQRLASVAMRAMRTPLEAIGQFDQGFYMRRMVGLLRAQGVSFTGMPVFIAADVQIDRSGRVTLGDRCVLSSGVVILTHDFSLDRHAELTGSLPPTREMVRRAPVEIREFAFIGMQALILPGVTVGKGSVVAARSVVTEDVADGMIVAGAPARPIRSVAEAFRQASDSTEWMIQNRRF